MKTLSWETKIGLILVALAIVLNGLLYAMYHDLNHIMLWGLTNLAFLPVSVLFVSLILDSLMEKRNKLQKLDKLNMLIGTFFSVAGTPMLRFFAAWDLNQEEICTAMTKKEAWTDRRHFYKIKETLEDRTFKIDEEKMHLSALRDFLLPHTDFMLRLLENAHVLEHEAFTDVLRSAFHLTEELKARQNLDALPESDRIHLARDIERVYGHLALAWTDYMKHLHREFPYLFSFALRINPFDPEASAIVS
ncbi:hypothetical protein [Desulfoluna sp.]|uniref:hypothetical protein n=1 Tax=Desulfoluna sp. TaxID=2045199 RepID=UPI0026385784|nr:hypothetical protein [Desulfoluna sp.]